MTLWQNLKIAAGMSAALPWAPLAFFAAFAASYLLVPRERPRLRISVFLFGLSFLGLVLAGGLLTFEPPGNTAYLAVRCCAFFVGAAALINVAGVLIFAAALHSIRLDPPRILQDLLIGLSYIVAAILLLSSNGLDVTGIVATSAVISAVIGFSLQDTLGNVMGGLALQLERTVRPGDWIRVDEFEGRVKEIRWRQTSIETRDWDTVVIPNSVLMKAKLTLLGQRNGFPVQRRRWIYFNVDFRYAPTDVVRAVESALVAEQIPSVAREPKAHCIVTEFKESYLRYAARYWLTDLTAPDLADSLVRIRIVSALRRSGIPLSIPAQSVMLTQDGKSHHEQKEREELKRRTAALRDVAIFKTLTEEERAGLATTLKNAPFVQGEAMTRQGTIAHSLYILLKGEASVHVEINGISHQISTLREGDFFGEMGMMTGEPRTATVIAETDVECYRMGREAFEGILRSRHEIAESISHTLVQRRMELDALHDRTSEKSLHEQVEHTQGALLERIRAFFGLDEVEQRKDGAGR